MLASQAENASRRRGEAEKLVEFSCIVQRERAMNNETIIASRQMRAESRWDRWNASPVSPRIKADEKAKWVGVIRPLWT